MTTLPSTVGLSANLSTGRPLQSMVALLEKSQRVNPYLVLILSLVFATGLRFLLNPIIGTQFPYATFYIAVVIATAHGGGRFGAIATVAGFILGQLLFVGDHSLLPQKTAGLIGGLIYLLNCVIVVVLAEAQRSTYAVMQKHAHALEVQTAQREQKEQQTQETLTRLTLVLEAAGLGTWEFDPKTGAFTPDERGKAIHGLDQAIVTTLQEAGQTILEVDKEQANISLQEAITSGKPYKVVTRVLWPDGSVHWVLSQAGMMTMPDGPRLFGIVQDITAQHLAEAEREAALHEVEDLNIRLKRAVQETHHRVKNNLQVIAALAEMEAQTEDNVPVAVLHRIGAHARTLALIHDILTQQSREFGEISDRVPVRRVMERLMPLVQSTIGERTVTATFDDFSLTSRDGGSVALLINELVSNAVKHGGSTIEITLRETNGKAILTIMDNGPGFPDGFTPSVAANTGLELVDSVARWDLRGDLHFENRENGGARVIVTFPV